MAQKQYSARRRGGFTTESYQHNNRPYSSSIIGGGGGRKMSHPHHFNSKIGDEEEDVVVDYSSPFDGNSRLMSKMSKVEVGVSSLKTIKVILGLGLFLLILLLTSSIILNVMMGKALISAQSSSFTMDAFRKTFYNALFSGIQSDPDLKKSFDEITDKYKSQHHNQYNTANSDEEDVLDEQENQQQIDKEINHKVISSDNHNIMEHIEHEEMLSEGDKIIIHYIANSIVQFQHMLYKTTQTVKFMEHFGKSTNMDVSSVFSIENIRKMSDLFSNIKNIGENADQLLNEENRNKLNEMLNTASQLAPQTTDLLNAFKNITGKTDQFLEKLLNGKQDVKFTLKK